MSLQGVKLSLGLPSRRSAVIASSILHVLLPILSSRFEGLTAFVFEVFNEALIAILFTSLNPLRFFPPRAFL